MNNLTAEVGYTSLPHVGEELCGDHVECIDNRRIKVIVLADGLGSGVKANILSTLTAKIAATMMAEGLPVEDCVDTIVGTLPVCRERNAAYSTFTILRIEENHRVELIEYDNPGVILLRDGRVCEYERTDLSVRGKTIGRARIDCRENDTFVAFSDGAVYAGPGRTMNTEWTRDDIARFLEKSHDPEETAKSLSARLSDKCLALYEGEPGDDVTTLAVRIRKRRPLHLLCGPPADPDDARRMLSMFFSKEGMHVVCGGTTSALAASFLGKPLITDIGSSAEDPSIPPIARIAGVDLVTEGALTLMRVLEYARDQINDQHRFPEWRWQDDGASRIARMLFEDATDINLFIGGAVNPANRDSGDRLARFSRQRLAEDLGECLRRMGKKVKISYYK